MSMGNRKTGTVLSLLFVLVVVLILVRILPDQLLAQEQNGIQVPTSGDVVSGIVIIEGTAWDPEFLRYELAFYQEFRPGADWIVFAQGEQAVLDGTLAVWDTTVGYPDTPVFGDGRYRLRLRIVRSDYNYDEQYISGLVIANEDLTPTPTSTITATLTTALAPLSGTAIAATARAGVQIVPSLTPFPTPSSPALPDNLQSDQIDSDENAEAADQTGLLDQLMGIDTGRFGRAFLYGVRIAAFIFLALAAYWLFRAAFRRIKQYIRTRNYK